MPRKFALFLILLIILVFSIFLFSRSLPFANGFVLIMSLLTLLWLYSLWLKDASIVDVFWGLGFVILAWYYFYLVSDSVNIRNLIFCSLVSIWGLRLALHIGIRNHGKGEDFRYQNWRKQGGSNYWWISYLRVFVLQGFLLWIIASPLLLAQTRGNTLNPLDYLAMLIWLIGFLFEFIGDWQLAIFKRNPQNKGKVMDKGLWKYTRHPNYFGDALLWWGYFLFAIPSTLDESFAYVISPLLMTFLLMQVSGVSLLEKTLVKTKPQYRDYIRKTSSFFPMFPKK